MPNTSESIQKKDCPGGMHAHTGYVTCHPLDKPHRPGTTADLYHQQMGIPNTWYENHHTTPEEYRKEHPKDDTPKEPKQPKDKGPKEESPKDAPKDYSKESVPGSVQWNSVKELKAEYPELYSNINKAQNTLDKFRNKEKVQPSYMLRHVMDDLLKGYTVDGKQVECKINPAIFNRVERHIAIQFIQDIIDGVKENPLGVIALRKIEFNPDRYSSTLMAYYPYGRKFEVNSARCLKSDFKSSNTMLMNIKGEMTQWDFHFQGIDSTNTIKHEYGHSISAETSRLLQCARNIPERSLMDFWNEPVSEGDYGNKITRRTEFMEKYTAKAREKDPSAPGVYLSIYIFDDKEDPKGGWINANNLPPEAIDELKGYYAKFDCELELKSEEEVTDLGIKTKRQRIYVRKKSDKLPELILESFKKDPVNTLDKMGYDATYADQTVAVERVKDCMEMYKKLYNVDKIDPTDVWSGYGFSATSAYNRNINEDKLIGLSCEERFAEAYQDVCTRKENANSMSKLMFAHNQYSLHKVLRGYEGTFEDFIRDKIGMEYFERLITKSIGRIPDDVNQRFVQYIKKSIQSKQDNTITTHQAFIDSVRKQFNMKIGKRLDWKSKSYTGVNGDGRMNSKHTIVVTEDDRVFDVSIRTEYQYRMKYGVADYRGDISNGEYHAKEYSTDGQMFDKEYPMDDTSNGEIEQDILSFIGSVKESYAEPSDFAQRYPPSGEWNLGF